MNNTIPYQNSVRFSKRKKLTSYICIVESKLDFSNQRVEWGERADTIAIRGSLGVWNFLVTSLGTKLACKEKQELIIGLGLA